jgi:glucose/arabinose dehydrogenase/cytochrome c2
MERWKGLLGLAVGLAALAAAIPSPSPLSAAPSQIDDGSQPFWIEQIAEGLVFPTAMVWLPNGDMLIPEREGGIRLVRMGKLDPQPLSGVPASFQNALNGPMDIALDPDFASNSLVYLLTSEGRYDAHGTAVYRMRWSQADHGFRDVARIFRSKDSISGSGRTVGRILFLADKTLLIGVTEDNYHRPLAQKLDSDIGKILRINRDGSVPADNPFVNDKRYLPTIWTVGHRVTSGLFRMANGDVYEVEPGPRGGDEFNLLEAGKNYGWASVTWGFDYGGGVVAPRQFAPGVVDPIFVWMPAGTPSGLTFYQGNRYPRWNGSFFTGLLGGMALERIRISGHKVLLREQLLTDFDERIRDVRVGPDNYLYLLTDRRKGRLLRLMPGRPTGGQIARVALKRKPAGPEAFAENLPGDAKAGRASFEKTCSACHSVAETDSAQDLGPNLRHVFTRQAGAVKGFNYSPAMAQFPQSWDTLSLNIFLANPQAYVPGTTMNSITVDDPQERVNIVTYLKEMTEAGKTPEFNR